MGLYLVDLLDLHVALLELWSGHGQAGLAAEGDAGEGECFFGDHQLIVLRLLNLFVEEGERG